MTAVPIARAVAGLALTLGLLAADARANPDYERALALTAKMAAALQSYEVKGNLLLENNVRGKTGGLSLDAAFDVAARWPDRLANSQISPMFTVELGTGPDMSWFYLSQTGAAYRGAPATLVRDLAGARDFALEPEKVFNFYRGLGELLLDADVAATAETGSETITVDGRAIPCQVFSAEAEAGSDGGVAVGPRVFWFDPQSGLCLKTVTTVYGRQNNVEVEQKMTYTVESFALNGDVPDSRFAYAIPAAARVVDSFARLTNPDALTGQAAPDVTLTGLDGGAFRLSDFRGQVVFLDLWATWCGPCRLEMPHIETLHRELGGAGDVVFLAASSEDKNTITKWLAKNPYSFRIAMISPADAQEKFKASSIPAGFVIDREGVIRAHMVGAQSEAQLRAALAKAGVGTPAGP